MESKNKKKEKSGTDVAVELVFSAIGWGIKSIAEYYLGDNKNKKT